MTRSPGNDRLQCDFVLEQTLGHVTHSQNLTRLIPQVDGIDATFVPVPFDVDGWAAKVPGFGNWTIRAGLRARTALARTWRQRGRRPDVLFAHTQVPAVLLRRAMRAVPSVVSLDATPQQYDSLGEHYAHEVGHPLVERAKTTLNRQCFDRATRLVTWSEWTKQSLIDNYDVDGDKITVIAPGVDCARWVRPAGAPAATGDVVRILFVGGDLPRKGGHHLLEAFGHVRAERGDRVELHLVTRTAVDPTDGVFVYANMTPNSAELVDLYHRSHIFCLPTLADCLPMVLPEAAAAGLTLVSTDVGAIGEIVRNDETGLLVAVGDVAGLEVALDRLVGDEPLRRRLAAAAFDLVSRDHDAATNAGRIADVIRAAHDAGFQTTSRP